MQIAFIIVALAALFALTFALRTQPVDKGADDRPGEIDPAAFSGLRSVFFATRPENITFPPVGSSVSPDSGRSEKIYGAAFEIGFPPGTVSVVALADGTASLYLETGGGIIGAGRHESVHRQAIAFVDRARELEHLGEPVTGPPPLPENRQVRFHWLGEDGVRSAAASELELSAGTHPLGAFYATGQNLLEQIRVAHTPIVS